MRRLLAALAIAVSLLVPAPLTFAQTAPAGQRDPQTQTVYITRTASGIIGTAAGIRAEQD